VNAASTMSDVDYSDDDDSIPASYGTNTQGKLPEGIKKDIIREADSKNHKKPKNGDLVTVDYKGVLEADGTEFDSSHGGDEPFVFTLGKGEVIKGWDLGIATMKKGEVAKFTLAPEFAYGAEGSVPKIPPNSTLVFTVELLSFVSKNDLFGDGRVTKSLLEEGAGYEKASSGKEVRMALKATGQDGSVIDDRGSFDYVVGSGALGPYGEVVDQALKGMLKGAKCSLLCAKGVVAVEGSVDAETTLEVALEELYDVSDVSFSHDDSVVKKRIKDGEGHKRPEDGGRVCVRVEAVTDGASPIASFSGATELKFVSGNGDVCDALESAVLQMRKSETAVIIVKDMEKCRDDKLGLKDVCCEKVLITVQLISFQELRSKEHMAGWELVEVAGNRKDVGAKLVKAQRWELALEKYKKVVDLLQDNKKLGFEFQKEGKELKKAAELNQAACLLKLGRFVKVITTCDGVLKEDPSNVKALFRRAKAHHERGDHLLSIRDLDRVLETDPANTEAKTLLAHTKRDQKAADKESKGIFENMAKAYGKMGPRKENKPEPKKVPEPPKERSDKVQVFFKMEYKPEPGEVVHVYGAPDALGGWDTAKSVPLELLPQPWVNPIGDGREVPKVYFWEASIEISESEGIAEYKYLIRGPDGDRVEDGDCHKVHLDGMGGGRQRCRDKWKAKEHTWE